VIRYHQTFSSCAPRGNDNNHDQSLAANSRIVPIHSSGDRFGSKIPRNKGFFCPVAYSSYVTNALRMLRTLFVWTVKRPTIYPSNENWKVDFRTFKEFTHKTRYQETSLNSNKYRESLSWVFQCLFLYEYHTKTNRVSSFSNSRASRSRGSA
jgi:hypothetical protein